MTDVQVFAGRLVIGSLYRANGHNCYSFTSLVGHFSLASTYANDCPKFQVAKPFLSRPLSFLSRLHNEILRKPGISAILWIVGVLRRTLGRFTRQ